MTAAESPRDLLAALQASITRASEIPATVTADAHTLVRDGWPHNWRDEPTGWLDGEGYGLCACGQWDSEPLPTTEARKAAHAQHVTEEQS